MPLTNHSHHVRGNGGDLRVNQGRAFHCQDHDDEGVLQMPIPILRQGVRQNETHEYVMISFLWQLNGKVIQFAAKTLPLGKISHT